MEARAVGLAAAGASLTVNRATRETTNARASTSTTTNASSRNAGSWEDEVLDEGPDEGPDAPEKTEKVVPGEGDGAVAAGQSGTTPSNVMQVDNPPPAPRRPLRIKKKARAGNVPPVSAPAASAGDETRAPAAPASKMHAWQHVNQVREDLREMRRPRSTQDEIGSVVSFLAAPTDPAVAPAGPSSQRGPSSSQRG